MTEAALMAHIIAQTQANVSFLQTHGYLSPSDAADVQNKLATAFTRKETTNGLVSLTRNMSIASPSQPTAQIPSPGVVAPGRYQSPPPQSPFQPPQSSPYHQPTPYNQAPSQPQWQPPSGPPPTSSYQSPPPPTVRARALWAYNEDGKEPNDLSFSAGETIEIVEETNPDWWSGRCRGRQGLFPSNYVEKLPPGSGPQDRGNYNPPSYGMVPSMSPPGGPPNGSVIVSNDQQQQPDKKKSKFGGLGNTMATSAAGGLGFGAGAAVGSGIINSIF